MPDIKVIARVDPEKYRQLKHVLVDENSNFSEWLRQRIDDYLVAMKPKAPSTRRKRG